MHTQMSMLTDSYRMHCLQIKGVIVCVILLLMMFPWFLCVVGKCIFDEVQSSIKVLSQSSTNVALNEANKHLKSAIATKDDGLTHLRSTPCYKSSHHSKPHRIKRTNTYKNESTNEPLPIRIKTWTPRERPILSDWETLRLEAAVNEAISTVSNLLSVIKAPDRLLLNRDVNKYCRFIWRNSSTANYNRCGRANENYKTEHCLGVTIPDDHLRGCFVHPHPDHPILRVLKPNGAGVPDTDFLLYIHSQNTDKCKADSSVLAYSTHCQTDSNRRPVAGVMVICREQLSMEGFSHEHMVQTVIHELFHMLGFSKDLFSMWRGRSPSSQMEVECCSHSQVTNTDEAEQMRLYSPHVMKALQTHLNSTDTGMGALLENQDADSRGISSHWEARALQGSIMTAVLPEPSLVRIDPITLSALLDTGWYSVNLSRAQSLPWGENKGALFGSLATCNSSSFFCNGSGLGCHYLHLHKGECQSDQYLDSCRIYKPLTNASACWNEENGRSGVEEWGGEIFHADSRCFLSSLSKENSSSSVSVAGRCYKHRCTGRNRYQIQVLGSDWLDCPAGKSIEVFGYRGVIFCPNKRLCYYKDVLPPTFINKSLHLPLLSNLFPFRERNHSLMEPSTSSQFSLKFVPVLLLAAMLSITASLSLLASITSFHKKFCSDRLRVHAVSI